MNKNPTKILSNAIIKMSELPSFFVLFSTLLVGSRVKKCVCCLVTVAASLLIRWLILSGPIKYIRASRNGMQHENGFIFPIIISSEWKKRMGQEKPDNWITCEKPKKHMPNSHTYFSFYSSFAKKVCVWNISNEFMSKISNNSYVDDHIVVLLLTSPRTISLWRKNKRFSCQIPSFRKLITFRTDKSHISIYYWKCICMVCVFSFDSFRKCWFWLLFFSSLSHFLFRPALAPSISTLISRLQLLFLTHPLLQKHIFTSH